MPTHRPHEVAVFGATGYTGKQIVRELVDAGRDVVCVGRDRAKLDALAAKLDRPVHIEVAQLTDPPESKPSAPQRRPLSTPQAHSPKPANRSLPRPSPRERTTSTLAASNNQSGLSSTNSTNLHPAPESH
jgi:hypothetical protein